MNAGIENIRKRGSRIVAEGYHMLPAASPATPIWTAWARSCRKN
jgi:hypothetical protein